jgi:hypothetical protein
MKDIKTFDLFEPILLATGGFVLFTSGGGVQNTINDKCDVVLTHPLINVLVVFFACYTMSRHIFISILGTIVVGLLVLSVDFYKKRKGIGKHYCDDKTSIHCDGNKQQAQY